MDCVVVQKGQPKALPGQVHNALVLMDVHKDLGALDVVGRTVHKGSASSLLDTASNRRCSARAGLHQPINIHQSFHLLKTSTRNTSGYRDIVTRLFLFRLERIKNK